MGPQDGTVEQRIAWIAARQHGVVSSTGLREAGISAREIGRRAEKGALIRVHRGVYRVGHAAPSIEADYMAAVLAAGGGAVLGGRAAAYLYGLVKGGPPAPEVAAPTNRVIPGVITRRLRALGHADTSSYRGIPITTLPRTLVDLAARLPEDELARAVHEATVRHRLRPALVDAVLERRPNAPGSKALRRILRGETRVALSKLERRFLERLRAARLPLPATNSHVDGRYVDCRWPEQRLTVELDGYRFHATRHAWEQDREREREARRRGDEFRRYTYRDVVEDPAWMLADLRRLLGDRRQTSTVTRRREL